MIKSTSYFVQFEILGHKGPDHLLWALSRYLFVVVNKKPDRKKPKCSYGLWEGPPLFFRSENLEAQAIQMAQVVFQQLYIVNYRTKPISRHLGENYSTTIIVRKQKKTSLLSNHFGWPACYGVITYMIICQRGKAWI